MHLLKRYWPIVILLAVNIVLIIANFKPQTYLTGWDNLMPELNFSVNIERSLFAVWQEYQSLGLLGGMGHATDLPRQIFLFLLSGVIPNELLRYLWTYLTLFLGGLGTYFLVKYIFEAKPKSNEIINQSLALVAALFYTLNLATVQTYYIVFETFSGHFAALPWIILAILVFLRRANLRNLAFLSLVFILSLPSFYVPTLFVVTILSIAIIGAVFLIMSDDKLEILKRLCVIGATIFVINAYWLLPFAYYTLTNSQTNVSAKINQMATETIFLQNKEFGDASDVALLKGFTYNAVDPDKNGNNMLMFAPWRSHYENPIIPALGYSLFALMILGFLSCIIKRREEKDLKVVKVALALLFVFAFTMLAVDTPPFSYFDDVFRKLPLFSQAFRFPFTKFSLLAGLAYSIMLVFGLNFSFEIFKKIKHRAQFLLHYGTIALVAIAIVAVALPAFEGHLFYDKERIAIPQEYFDTFNYFKNAPQNARIADLPQPAFWGWTLYQWGGGGSGFLWYGIRQPILDRAFDVWSENSENYYYELSDALYSRNPQNLDNVLNKYQISYVLLDENVIYPSSPKSLFYDETKSMLNSLPNVKLDKRFGNISIYKVTLKDKPNSFVFSLPADLPKVSQPYFKTRDITYSQLGDYVVGSNNIVPFATLFSQKLDKKQNYTLTQNANSIKLSTNVKLDKKSKLNVPIYDEKIIPVDLFAVVGSKSTIVSAVVKLPEILIDGKKVAGDSLNIDLFNIPTTATYPINININGISNFELHKSTTNYKIGTSFLTGAQNNAIVASGKNISSNKTITRQDLESLLNQPQNEIMVESGTHTITVLSPKITDQYLSFTPALSQVVIDKCDGVRTGKNTYKTDKNILLLDSTNSALCASYYSPNMLHDTGYAIFLKAKNDNGRTLHFWILNEDQKTVPMDLYLDEKENQSYVLSAAESGGIGYSFHFDNISIGRDRTKNTLSLFDIYPLPTNYIEHISIGIPHISTQDKNIKITSVNHPNESLYIVSETTKGPGILALSQSYDAGWQAYYFENNPNIFQKALPFVFGKHVKEHVKLNDWENGWMVDNSGSIEIVYLPQYLEYFGFLLLMIGSIWLTIKLLKKHKA